ncbi:MAG TPA: hypothetical protein VFA33_06995 [Bryobacteraceae bacterium]|nr:hypothetical protein [Bryobacteraceae bacterium]
MIRVRFQPTNPGQFFACCGLLELADRLWDGAEGWFEERTFRLRLAAQPRTSLPDLLTAIAAAPLRQSDADDETSSPIEIPAPFGLRLDWWQESAAGCKDLKTWAGRMSGARIARAMQAELGKAEYHHDGLLDHGAVVYDPAEPAKKVEPFYFDARRGACGHPLDIGFAPDPLQMTSAAYAAVEFLCLVGLQRFRPKPGGKPRVFEYCLWRLPLAPAVAAAAVCGFLAPDSSPAFRFENAFRTDQRKHKGFASATPV